jgi:TonB-dependent starch-binding outer membrane protein SusC
VAKIRSLFTLALFAVSANVVGAQQTQRRITGRVTAEGTGEPIVSAQVAVTGTSFATTTGDDGSFAVTAPIGDARLIVRRIGYTRRDVPVVAGTNEVNVQLVRDVLQLETQVVTGAATTVSSLNAATSNTVISAEQLTTAPAQTIDNALQGKIPGAIITQNSGAPGGGLQVQIRGVTSLNASSSPLYVVDGVLINNSAINNGLNALTQASGGNAPSSQDQAVNRVADINPNDIETIEVLKGAAAGAIYGSKGSNGVIVITTKRGRAGKPQVNVTQRLGAFDLSNKLGLRCYSAAEAKTLFKETVTNPACNDFEEQLYGRHDLSYETIASVSGGTQTGTNYFFSGLVHNDAGIQQNTGYKKQSLRANIGQQLGSRLSVQVNSELLHSLTERGIAGNDNGGFSPYTVFSVTPTYFDFKKQNGAFPSNPYIAPALTNPLQTADLVRTPEDVFRLIGSATGRLSVYSSERQTVDATVTGGVDHYNLSSKLYSPRELFYEPLDGYPGTIVDNQGNVSNVNLNGTLAHRYIAGTAFTATSSAGFRQERFQTQTLFNTGRNVPTQQTNVSTAVIQSNGEAQTLVKDLSYFVQEEFLTLGERLLLTAAVNAERSSVNGDQKKFYGYPKFSASYRLPFLPTFTDNIKLRAAYGRAGNKPPFESAYTLDVISFNDNSIGSRPSRNLGNPNIKPEQTTEIEGGLDAAFFGGRASLEATQFRKQVDNLILFPRLAPSTGFGFNTVNGGRLVNHGTELGLTVQPFRVKNFDWVSRTTYASVKGKVTHLDIPSYLYGIGFGASYADVRIKEGYSPTQVIATAAATTDGALIETKQGDALPDFTMGFSNDFTVGPLRLASTFDWRKGGVINNLTNAYFDGILPGGEGTLADTAGSNYRNANFFSRAGYAAYIEKGTFVKLRELTLSYSLPKSLSSRMLSSRANDVRLELTGRNLYTWTKYTGLDPEVSNFSNQQVGRIVDVTPFPPSRSYFVSINANF